MNEIFFTSDTHFCHNREFLYKPRGFNSPEEMNEAIVERWNSTVPRGWGAIVYHLGDIALSDTDAAIPYIKRLNGEIRWIRGNHDTDMRIKKITEECHNIASVDWNIVWADIFKDNKWRFYLSHYPTKVANYDDIPKHKLWCLCGHTHTQDRWKDLADSCYHVEMDAHNCYPISLEQIKAEIKALNV